MTLISLAFSPRVCEDHGRISHSQFSPTGQLRSTSSPLPRTETRISCAAQCRKKNLSIRLMTSRVLCVCVCVSLLFLSITITGEVWTALPCSSAACVAAMRTGGVRMCQEEVVLLPLFITHTRAVIAFFVLRALTYFILFICTHHSLQQLSGNPLVRRSMHVGVWEDSPGCQRWNTNAAPRKPWRMAVSCCRC